MNERYERDLQRGLEFQDHVTELFAKHLGISLANYASVKYQQEHSDTVQGIEVKYDSRFRKTEKLFIEYRERSDPSSKWHDSGVLCNPSVWALAIGDYDAVFILSIRLLNGMIKARPHYRKVETETAMGVLLPVLDAEKYAIFFLPPPITVPFSQRNGVFGEEF